MDTTEINLTGIELIKKHSDFLGIKWVLKATSKETSSFLLEDIIFDSGKWVGTDGHRIHIYESQESFKEGIYESTVNNSGKIVLKSVSDKLSKYPEWKTVFSELSKTPVELRIEPTSHSSVEYTKIIRCMEASVTLNFQFFEDLLIGTTYPWVVHIYEKLGPVHFISERKTGIIMPMHV